MSEIGRDKATGVIRVRVNAKYYRPTEVVSVASCFDSVHEAC